ncbi:thioredoxin family protein [Listeria innocua]
MLQAPILDQLEQEYDEEEFRIAKMDVDENPETPQQFGIMSIPTLMLKKDGQVVEKAVGVHSKEQLRQMIDQYL